MFRLVAALTTIVFLPACLATGEPTKTEPAPYDVRVGADGKADGLDGILDAEDFARLEEAFDRVIEEGEATIDKLEDEIADLEATNAAKAAEIDSLVQQIEDRRDELEDQHNDNLLLCVFFPNPATCALAVMIANDSRMQQLERDLDDARDAQREAQEDIAKFEARKAALEAELVPLRASKDRLIELFESGVTPAELPAELEAGTQVAEAYARADVLSRIAAATGDEIEILVDIRNAAAELAGELDAALDELRALATSVDQLVADARNQFMDLIEALLSEDPAAVARDWLDDALADRTRELLAGLDWPIREFVDHLIAARPGEDIDLDALTQDLLDKLLDGNPAPSLALSSNVEIQVLDKTDAVSVLEVDEAIAATTAEVTVRIEHTWISDLKVWLEHDGVELVLHDRTGGSADDIFKTYSVELPSGIDVTGAWRLHVEDTVSADEGRLLGWDLLLR